MKRLLGIVVLGFFYFNFSIAEIIELDKCIAIGNDQNHQWSEERYKTSNTIILVPKDLFAKEYKNWGFKDYWKKNIEEAYGNTIAVGFSTKYPKKFYDVAETQNFRKIQLKEKDIFSIDTSTGFITNLRILTDEGVDARKSQYLKGKYEFMYKKTNIHKYLIDTYLSTNIIAHAWYDFYDDPSDVDKKSPVLIDLEKGTVSKTYSNGDNATILCKPLFFSNDNSEETKLSSGTAFFINNKGHLITNNHVVDGCKKLKINYKNKEFEAKIISTDKLLDLALLKIEVRPKSFINFSNYNPKKLQKIYVAGYPFGKGLSDDLKISSGIISSLKGLEDNSNELQIDAAINHGNSGGPIVGEGGELVAIAVSGLRKEMSEGINFGIKSSAALNFLSANGIETSRSNRTKLSSDNLLNILEESTLYISCIY